MATISKGIKLSYKPFSSTGEFRELSNLQEIPELGGSAESIEITTLADAAHTYTAGILNYGDSLAFKFLYEKEQFDELVEGSGGNVASEWQVSLPDNTTCSFMGTYDLKLDGVGVNAALTYTLSVKPSSEMLWK